jgi:hypothetical protein
MAMPWIYAVRLVQILFGLIVVALTAYGKYIHNSPMSSIELSSTTSSNITLVYTNPTHPSSNQHLLLLVVFLRHSKLPPLPRLLDHLRRNTLPPRRTNLLPAPGASLRDSRRRGDYYDLLVCGLYRDCGAVAGTRVLYLEWMSGFAGCCCVWGF